MSRDRTIRPKLTQYRLKCGCDVLYNNAKNNEPLWCYSHQQWSEQDKSVKPIPQKDPKLIPSEEVGIVPNVWVGHRESSRGRRRLMWTNVSQS